MKPELLLRTTLHPSFGPPRGACHPPSAPRAEGGGSEAHFRHTLEPWKLSAALPQYHQQTGLTEKGMHEACIAKNWVLQNSPSAGPPRGYLKEGPGPRAGEWTLVGTAVISPHLANVFDPFRSIGSKLNSSVTRASQSSHWGK